MKEPWVVYLTTNIGSGEEPNSGYENDFEKKLFAFENFEDAKKKALELIKSYAFSENSMFDGNGGIKKLKAFLKNVFEDEWFYKDSEDYPDNEEPPKIVLKTNDIIYKVLKGEYIDLPDEELCDYDFCSWEAEITRGKKLTIKNANSLLYGWIISTDMINIETPGNYSLYIRDNLNWDDDDPSILQVEIVKAE